VCWGLDTAAERVAAVKAECGGAASAVSDRVEGKMNGVHEWLLRVQATTDMLPERKGCQTSRADCSRWFYNSICSGSQHKQHSVKTQPTTVQFICTPVV